jgi:hypothetical protein
MDEPRRLTGIGCSPDTHVYLGDGIYAGFDGFNIWCVVQRNDRYEAIAFDPRASSKFIQLAQQHHRLMLDAPAYGWIPIPATPMRTLAPYDGRYYMLGGPSGYVGTPIRVAVCKYDIECRPRNPWVDYSGKPFSDGGGPPKWYAPLFKDPT